MIVFITKIRVFCCAFEHSIFNHLKILIKVIKLQLKTTKFRPYIFLRTKLISYGLIFMGLH